jgi:hypothetical protein
MSGRGRGIAGQFKKLQLSEESLQASQHESKASGEQFAEAENVQSVQETSVPLRRIVS